MGKQINEFNKEEIQEICYKYDILKISRMSLSKLYDASDRVIQRILKENNIPLRGIKESSVVRNRKFNVNDDYFKTQSENMGYWLGILHADGCIAKNENCIKIELQRDDRGLLEKLNTDIKNEREVKDYVSHSHNREYLYSVLYFYSYIIKEDLKQYGLCPNKTYDMVNCFFPHKLNKQYIPDFIRGLFDGDGSIYKLNTGSIGFSMLSSHKDILEEIQKYFYSEHGIILGLSEEKPSSNNKQTISKYKLEKYDPITLRQIYQILYGTKSNLFLDRKKELFDTLLKEKSV